MLAATMAIVPRAASARDTAAEVAAIQLTTLPSIELAQVTSVFELSDVQPGDWAYSDHQRLVEDYGCLEGYPERSFRGERALTRYEVAAGLNACLDVVIPLVSVDEPDVIRQLYQECLMLLIYRLIISLPRLGLQGR